jgi:hypothetical protein
MTFPHPIFLPQAPGGDPYWDYVLLLLQFYGTDGATATTDLSKYARPVTFNDNAQLDETQSRWAGSSLLCDGSGDYVSVPDSDDWTFSGPFTVEAWVRYNVFGGAYQQIISHYGVTSNSSWSLRTRQNIDDGFTWWASVDGTGNDIGISPGSGPIVAGQWFHFAVDRDAGGVLRNYIDGVMQESATQPGTYFNSTVPLTIGRSGNAGVMESFNGWIDSVRITGGVARYASSPGFQPPTGPFPTGP